MRQFSVFTAPYYSFFSRKLYSDVGRRWGAKTFAYLLLLLALSWIPFMLGVQSAWVLFLRDDAPALVQQIPPITIENGRVSVDTDQPHFMRTTGTDEVFAIIDTTGQITSLDDTSAKLLLTGSQFIAEKSETEIRVYDLSGVQQFYLDGPRVEKWLRLFGTWGVILLYPVVVTGSYLYRIAQALFYSMFGLMIAKAEQCRLGYGGILRITIVAITPALVVKTLLGMVSLSFPFSWLVFFLIAIGYLAFGLSSQRDEPTSGPDIIPIEPMPE